MRKSDHSELLSPLDVALAFKVSTRTVTRWADDPDHPLTVAEYTEGGQRRFLRSHIEQLAAEVAA